MPTKMPRATVNDSAIAASAAPIRCSGEQGTRARVEPQRAEELEPEHAERRCEEQSQREVEALRRDDQADGPGERADGEHDVHQVGEPRQPAGDEGGSAGRT